MFFKAALFDLDDTLYSYDDCHRQALTAVLEAIGKAHDIPVPTLASSYAGISARLKDELGHTAACHSRFIYFKQLLAAHRLPLSGVLAWHSLYWRLFHEAMRPAEGVHELLALLRARGVKIILVSDFLIQQQFEKLTTLGIIDCFDEIITSEEIGIEKPSSTVFLAALAAAGVSADQVIMIGDSFRKDIAGAAGCGIHGFWIDPTQTAIRIEEQHSCFPSIAALSAWLHDLDGDLDRLERISRMCGERFDLTQAAGGNISVKSGGCLCVKSSGLLLSDVNRRIGYSVVDNARLLADVESGETKPVAAYTRFTKARASIETYMHAVLNRYTVHLHPIQLNEILTREDGATTIKALFPDSLVLDYIAPGVGIAQALWHAKPVPNIVFLMNHGVIVSSDSFDELLGLIERVVGVCEAHLGCDYGRYRAVTPLSSLLNDVTGLSYVSYLCEDQLIGQGVATLTDLPPLFPDLVVYCGTRILRLDPLDREAVEAHLADHGVPKLIAHSGGLYIYDQSLRKCRDTESVLKSLALLLANSASRQSLRKTDVDFITSWEAEAYRKTLQA